MSVPAKFSLFKRNNGIYYFGYRDGSRKRWKSTACRTKADALKAITQLQSLLKTKPASLNLSEFASQYITHAEATLAPGTVQGYKMAIRAFCTFVGDCLLSEVTPKQIDAYKLERLKSVKPVTVNIELRSLRAAFGVALRWKLLENNPFKEMVLARVDDAEPGYVSKADLQSLMVLIKENWLKELIVFAVATGVRRGEMLNLRWQDVDLAHKTIRIQSSDRFRTKTGNCHTIPMSEMVHALLRQKAGRSTCEYVFSRRGARIGESYLSHRFKWYVRVAGLNGHLHWHSLRHTFASWLAQDGVSLFAIQKLLGHSSANVTQIYSHLQPDQMHETVNRISVSMN